MIKTNAESEQEEYAVRVVEMRIELYSIVVQFYWPNGDVPVVALKAIDQAIDYLIVAAWATKERFP